MCISVQTLHQSWLQRLSFPLISLVLTLGFSAHSVALQSLDDTELGDVTGQAFINITNDSIGNTDYTRVNLGLNVATQLSVDEVAIGRYNRQGEANGSADIEIDNFALGSLDGNGNPNPFLIRDPYLEFAYEGEKMTGFRLGFGEAKGSLGGTIQSLTGNVPVLIEGAAGPLRDAAADVCIIPLFGACLQNGRQLLGLGGVDDDTILRARAQLVDENGNLDPTRASQVGLPNGDSLDVVSGGGLLSGIVELISSDGCSVLGVATCFSLSNYESLFIGNENTPTPNLNDFPTADAIEGAARGMFLSMQFQDNVQWRDLENPAETINTMFGAFMNVPETDGVPSIVVDFNDVFAGTPLLDQCVGSQTVGC